ncbi:MAG TPA: hypothetical protein EYG31_13670 [Porticoccaceae bacterium]|nr:hypothetical protein [Gammaproteobacteria bacterium]HIL61670.1 hypothetical protein [Porticoccaceae bacterium]
MHPVFCYRADPTPGVHSTFGMMVPLRPYTYYSGRMIWYNFRYYSSYAFSRRLVKEGAVIDKENT